MSMGVYRWLWVGVAMCSLVRIWVAMCGYGWLCVAVRCDYG